MEEYSKVNNQIKEEIRYTSDGINYRKQYWYYKNSEKL
jgi:hypothetical protein